VTDSDGIVIVGGGFAGFWAAVAARRAGGDQIPITMVSPAPVLQIRPRLYEAHPETLGVDLLPLLDKVRVRFVETSVSGVDVIGHVLTLESGDTLGYDRLVIATGSVMRRPPAPGADEAFSIDNQAEAIAFDRRLAEVARSRRHPSIAVVGAGFTGIELALELRDRIATHGAETAAVDLRIVLIDQADVVGNDLGPGPRPVIEAAMDEAGIELCLGASITSLSANHVIFEDGARLDVDAVVLATGLAAAPLTAEIPGERDAAGRIVVDRFLRAPQADHVFVTGDSAAADTGDGHRTMQSCQHALQLGRFAGENAARDLRGMPLVPYEQPRYVTCLDLGRSGAVFTTGWDRTVTRTGSEAKDIKQSINTKLIYPSAEDTAETLLGQSEITIRRE
jgi:NADH dehydrogenase